MKQSIALLFTFAILAAAIPPPASAADEDNRAAAIGRLMDAWQARILASNLPVEDAKNWSLRNTAKFARLNAERLALAQRADSLGELELALLEAPLAAGSPLDIVMANRRGDISMIGVRSAAKSSPATSPAAYAGLVFTAVTTCRILDTRPSQGGFGAWVAGSSNMVKIGPYSTAGGGYASGAGAQGGSATSCGLDALAGPGQIAVIMAAVSTVSQAGPGYITFYPQGAPNPGTTSVSQWYQAGYVQTSFVLIPTDLLGTVAASAFTSTSTDVIIDVVGYFAAETAEGTVTAVTASAPIASSGGAAPNISLTGGASGQVLVGTAGAPAWTGSPSLSGNLVLGASTSSAGNITKSGIRFVHDYGGFNVFVGQGAGNFTLTGSNNTASGVNALSASTTGGGNTASGVNSLLSNTTGNDNAAQGRHALYSNTDGASNTACGAFALALNTTGSGNIAIGYNAGVNLTTGSNNITIGHIGNTAESNTIRIGDGSSQTRAFISGIRGVTTGTIAAVPVLIDTFGQLGTISSSRSVKDDITDMDAASSALMKLRPVTFHYKSDRAAARVLQYGLVAEEVEEVYPELVAHSIAGEVETVMYQFLPPMMLNEMQKQQRRIDAQANEIAELKKVVEELRAARR